MDFVVDFSIVFLDFPTLRVRSLKSEATKKNLHSENNIITINYYTLFVLLI